MSRRSLLVSIVLAGVAVSPMDPFGSAARAQGAAAPGAAVRPHLDRTPAAREGAQPGPVLDAMQAELRRSMEELRKRAAGAPPYYIAYEVTDRRQVAVVAAYGALLSSDEDRRRTLDVDVRVGDHKLDNTHHLRGDAFGGWSRGFGAGSSLPLDDDAGALRASLWLKTDERYKDALEQLTNVEAQKKVKVKEEDEADDFSREEPVSQIAPPAALSIDRAAWEKRIREYSAQFRRHPEIEESQVQLHATATTRYLASSEGTRAQLPSTHVRLAVRASTRADDGMELERHEAIDAATPDRLPPEQEIRRRIQVVIDDLLAMRKAPLAEPYVGPAILEGRAAGVFFHEVFGHRVEGHRQKNEEEGQTFAKKIGQRIMPDFVDVYDDPTVRSLDGVDLNGHYDVDDEGVPAERASLVKGGVLTGFLMSRSPVRGFSHSNGHGRRQEGHEVVARQANLIVDPARTTTPEGLTRLLLQEVERQGKAYGLRFKHVEGGYTGTVRSGPQAFKVMPVIVTRVFPDGREELVRGADIEGTPLTSLSKILAAADDFAVFNGYCGAESGFVPVSAASPSLLVAQVEIARRAKGNEKPPILPSPPLDVPDSKGGAR